MKSLGFRIKDGKSSNHKIFVHDALSGFTTGSFACGHGKNSEVKRPYIRNILKILYNYENELKGE